MKKVWSRPQTEVQGFEANEYVASCTFTCEKYEDKKLGSLTFRPELWLETNGREELQTSAEWWSPEAKDTKVDAFVNHNEMHSLKHDDAVMKGYITYTGSGFRETEVKVAKIGNEYHVGDLNQTAKS